MYRYGRSGRLCPACRRRRGHDLGSGPSIHSSSRASASRRTAQQVVTSGPYRFVRHPGYTAAIAVFIAIPLALASWWALTPAALAIALLVVRTGLEDGLLRAELSGYVDYTRRTRYRLLPGLW